MNKKKLFHCVWETLLVNIILYYLFYKIQSNPEIYLQLNPHPLFLLCIAMGLRYGNLLGIVSAAISSVFYVYVFYHIHGDLLILVSYFKYYKYLLLFFWSAMILGFFKDNHTASMERILNDNRLIIEHYDELSKKYKLLQKIQDETRKQVINSEESILYLYEIASKLETFDSEEIYTETIGILSKFLKADTVSVYAYNEESGYIRLKIRIGMFSTEKRSMLISDSPGLSKVIYQKQAVKWADVNEEGFPLMSAPIIQGGKVVAIVNIEHMDFDQLSEYAYQLFKLIINWVNRAFEQAIYVEGLKESKFIDGTRIMQFAIFLERLQEEERRKKEFGMDYCLVKFKIADISIDSIDMIMRKTLRTVDVVSYNPLEKILFILLPATPADHLQTIEARVKKNLDEHTINNKVVRD